MNVKLNSKCSDRFLEKIIEGKEYSVQKVIKTFDT